MPDLKTLRRELEAIDQILARPGLTPGARAHLKAARIQAAARVTLKEKTLRAIARMPEPGTDPSDSSTKGSDNKR